MRVAADPAIYFVNRTHIAAWRGKHTTVKMKFLAHFPRKTVSPSRGSVLCRAIATTPSKAGCFGARLNIVFARVFLLY